MKKGKPTYTTVQWDSLDDPDKFRDADRIEEAQRIPLTESQRTLLEQENKELKEDQKETQQIPLTESQKAQEQLEPIEKGVCVTGELRKARENDRKKGKINSRK